MQNLESFLFYVLIAIFTPGPNNIIAMATGSRLGYKKTFPFVIGVITGFFIVFMLSIYFNLILFNLLPKVKIFMSFIGAGYMLYLAFKIMKSSWNDNNSKHAKKEDENLFVLGVFLQFINPKGILFSITVVGNFVIPYYSSTFTYLLFGLSLASLGFIACSSWALFGSLFSNFMAKYNKQFNFVMGILLIYTAYSISGISNLIF